MRKLESLAGSLKKANRRLKEASEIPPARINKDAAIKRFELSWKTIQEWLRDEGLEAASPKQSIREGAKFGIIDT